MDDDNDHRYSLRIPKPLFDAVARMALKKGASINQYIVETIHDRVITGGSSGAFNEIIKSRKDLRALRKELLFFRIEFESWVCLWTEIEAGHLTKMFSRIEREMQEQGLPTVAIWMIEYLRKSAQSATENSNL